MNQLGQDQGMSPGLLERLWSVGGIVIVLALVVASGVLYLRLSSSLNPRPVPSSTPGATDVKSPSVVRSLTVASQLDFKCTLPINVYGNRVRISFPAGQVNVDGIQTYDPGGLSNNAYVYGRWLPVPTSWVSPDGRAYASTTAVPGTGANQSVLVTDVGTGKRRPVWTGAGLVSIVGWGSDGLYLLLQGTASSNDLFMIDPGNPGQARRVGPNGVSSAVGSTGPPSFSSETRLGRDAVWDVSRGRNQSQVERMDLRNGSASVWYTAPSNIVVNILGFDDQGHPVLELYATDTSSTVALGLLTGPNQVVQLTGVSAGPARYANAFADSHGIWIGTSGSLWLYRSGSLSRIADIPVAAVGAGTPMPIENAPGRTGNLPPPRVVGACN